MQSNSGVVEAETIRAALADAHIPTLMVALVHLTGDTSHLRLDRRPVYHTGMLNDPGRIDPAVQHEIREKAQVALENHLIKGVPLPAPPTGDDVRQMMNFVAGSDIPASYITFLLEELRLDGVDMRYPDWTLPPESGPTAGINAIIIGAGMSGLLAAIRLQQAGVPFIILEKNPDVGGTWLENSYPGCRVDSANHNYSYSFASQYHWPHHFSQQPAILQYFRSIADRFDLRPHIIFDTAVTQASYNEATTTWTVSAVTGAGERITRAATILVSAVGQLNRPSYPQIDGLASFAGPAFHSAEWRHDVDLAGKRVAVIGTGSSAFQFIPELAKQVGALTIFQRNPPWLFPTPDYHEPVKPTVQWLLAQCPFYEPWFRFYLFWLLTDGAYAAMVADPAWTSGHRSISALNEKIRARVERYIERQVDGDKSLLAKLIPDYPIGGKRGVRDNGVWIRTMKRPNVSLITDAISMITPEGVITADGTEYKVDVLIYGTGFLASGFLEPMRITGRNGLDLHGFWDSEARAYLGMLVPGFPNFFMLYGPNTNIVANGSIIFMSECSVRYMIGCLRLLASRTIKCIEVDAAVYESFNEKVDAMNAKLAWGASTVKSYYKSKSGRVAVVWPFRLVDYWEATLRPDRADLVADDAPSPLPQSR